MNRRKIIKISILALLICILLFAFFYIYPSLRIASGYAAKYTCSYSFLAGLKYDKIRQSFNFFPVNKVECVIDTVEKSVTASLFGIAERKSFYYQSGNICGCVLDSVNNIKQILQQNYSVQQTSISEVTGDADYDLKMIPDSFKSRIKTVELEKIISSAIDTNPATLAVTVAYKNFLVCEGYNEGLGKETRLLGWSMTKTLLNALLGIFEKNGKINLEETGLLDEWKKDERKNISLNNLMQMSSGLQWVEDYSIKADVTQMLYLEPDVSSFAMSKPLEIKPGEKWYYSSGTSNILSHFLRTKYAVDQEYFSFPFDSLFKKIGMNSATVEMDNTGNFVLSSYGWATARDWTKFGLLYLNKGNWNGTQIFSSSWSEYSIDPVASSGNKYGAQIWLNASSRFPSVPKDAFLAMGYGGQNILIVPSREIVVVFLSSRQKEFDFNSFYEQVLHCFE